MRLSLQPLICPADRFFGLLKLRRSDSYYRGKDVINDFSRALVLPYCDLPGYRKVGERLRASLSSQLDQLFQMPFVDQPRSFRGELSQRSFSFSILLFAFSRGGQHHHLSVVAAEAFWFRPRGYALLPNAQGEHRTPMRRSAPKIPRRRGSTADDRSSSRRRRQ